MFPRFNEADYLEAIAALLDERARAELVDDAQPEIGLTDELRPRDLIAPLDTKSMPERNHWEFGFVLSEVLTRYSNSRPVGFGSSGVKVVYVCSLYLHCYSASPVEFSDTAITSALRLILDAANTADVPLEIRHGVACLMGHVLDSMTDAKGFLAPRSLLLLSMFVICQQIEAAILTSASEMIEKEHALTEWDHTSLRGSGVLEDITAIRGYVALALDEMRALANRKLWRG